ncbi:MAG: OmpA family protein [Magnetovibrio sp.]|nr:OmpA family protein [Magnetovibrio sp.]
MEVQFKKLARREPRWLTSFADLMALLLCLFVMLLSFAEVDSDSFKKNAAPISEAFFQAEKKPKTTSLVQIDSLIPAKETDKILSASQTVFRLSVILTKEIENQNVEVEEFDGRVIIRFRDRAAFQSGSRDLTAEIIPTLKNVADVLANTRGLIHVEGHTDNIPITTETVRSNWDLSASRAASVVHILLQHPGIKSERISAVGLADSQPLVDNLTAANRAINRRVEIALEPHEDDTRDNLTQRLRYQ